MKFLILPTLILLSACSTKGMYEAVQQNRCMEETGQIYCNESGNYEEYKRERDEVLNKGEQKNKEKITPNSDLPSLK